MSAASSVSAARPLCRQCRRAWRNALRVAASATQAPPPVFSVPGMPRIDLRELTAEAGSADVLTGLRDVKVLLEAFRCREPASLLATNLAGPTLGWWFSCASGNGQAVSYVSRRRLDAADFDLDATDEEGLPLVYNEAAIAAFWRRRPGELAARWAKFAGISAPWLTRLATAFLRGSIDRDQVALARDAVANLSKLGPTWVKLGQVRSAPAASHFMQGAPSRRLPDMRMHVPHHAPTAGLAACMLHAWQSCMRGQCMTARRMSCSGATEVARRGAGAVDSAGCAAAAGDG